MTDLELWYRLLLRAYPSGHRARTDDEMLSTLLDVAGPAQRRPRLREAAALVSTGTIERLRTAGELAHGVRLAGTVALAFVVAAFVVAMPSGVIELVGDAGPVPLLVWLAALGALVFGTWSDRVYRLLPSLLVVLIVAVGGAPIAGLRRSVAIPVVILVLGAAATRAAAIRGRLVAAGAGAAWGLTVLYAMWSIRPEVWRPPPGAMQGYLITGSTWSYASAVLALPPTWLVVAFTVLLVAGLVRARFAVAAAILTGPLALTDWYAFRLSIAWGVLLATGAAIVGTAAPWLYGGRNSHTGGRA